MHFFFSFFRVRSAARVACSNTSRTPSFVLAEHSRYLMAPIFLRTSSACSLHGLVSRNFAHRQVPLVTWTYLLRRHRLLRGLVQLLNRLLVIPQILLAAHKDDRQALAEVQHLRDPLKEAQQPISIRPDHSRAREHLLTFSCTLSSESGESMAKQIRMTCESG